MKRILTIILLLVSFQTLDTSLIFTQPGGNTWQVGLQTEWTVASCCSLCKMSPVARYP